MARKSLEYWASANQASDEFEQWLDDAEAKGKADAMAGRKANAKGIFGTARTFYFKSYRETLAGQEAA